MHITFTLYLFISLILTTYYCVDLYKREKTFYIFIMYFLKSKFYFCIFLNFFTIILLIFGKLIVKFFFDEIRLSELSKVMENLRGKFFQIFLWFLSFKPKMDIKKIFFIAIYFSISFLTSLTYKRGSYITSSNERSKKVQIKIIFVYIFMILINNYLYEFSGFEIEKLQKQNINLIEYLIYYIINCEFLFLFITIFAKFFKLIINITCINMRKQWDYRSLSFNIISTLRYGVKILFEIRFCCTLFSYKIIPIYFFFDVLKSLYNLFKLSRKIYDTYKSSHYINNLTDYNFTDTIKRTVPEFDLMDENDKNKIKDEKMQTCIICLNTIEKGKFLNCGHLFHLKCIKEYLVHSANCPICKEPISANSNKKSKFFKERLGIVNNGEETGNTLENYDQEKHEKSLSTEELLEKLDLNEYEKGNGSIYFKSSKNSLLEKYDYLLKLQEEIEQNEGETSEDSNYEYNNINNNIYNKDNNKYNNSNNTSFGAVSYALPCEACYNRTIKSEINRLKIEFKNQKFLKLYEQPENFI